ncbi:MAG: DUF2946 family protein [Castellaniella sp.]|uniref:DUF2946 family protein n=1 Tax=Castellaniella sp. TaxID=1955812 RepID=UPI003A8AAF35
MDDQVLAAMARWPDVPAVRGWLSLSARGQWRLHPHGQGWGAPDETPGEAITNPQIIAFIGRNYQADDTGRWFFQNGPQRVYVRLDGAPWILHLHTDPQGLLRLQTHTGLDYGPVGHWWLDTEGRLFAQAAQGAGLLADHDLARMIDTLRATGGQSLDDWLEQPEPAGITVWPASAPRLDEARVGTPLGLLAAEALETTLGFIRRP